MRTRRRLSFAAPLVVVLACRRPIPDPAPRQDTMPDAANPIADASEAPVDVMIDAATVIRDAPIAADLHPDGCTDPLSHATCNPPPPAGLCKAHPEIGRCPKPPVMVIRDKSITARVLAFSVTTQAAIVTLAVGAQDGVDQDSTATLGPGQKLELVQAHARTSRWSTSASIDSAHVPSSVVVIVKTRTPL